LNGDYSITQSFRIEKRLRKCCRCQDAIRSARRDAGVEPAFQLDAPATAERIRLACEDDIMRQVPELPPADTFTPWGIQV